MWNVTFRLYLYQFLVLFVRERSMFEVWFDDDNKFSEFLVLERVKKKRNRQNDKRME